MTAESNPPHECSVPHIIRPDNIYRWGSCHVSPPNLTEVILAWAVASANATFTHSALSVESGRARDWVRVRVLRGRLRADSPAKL
jgi:hypothetical protein